MWAPSDDAPMKYFTLNNFFRTAKLLALMVEFLPGELKSFRWVLGNSVLIQQISGHDIFFPGDMNFAQLTWPIFGIVRTTDGSTTDVQSIPNIPITTKPMKTRPAYRLSKKDMTGNFQRLNRLAGKRLRQYRYTPSTRTKNKMSCMLFSGTSTKRYLENHHRLTIQCLIDVGDQVVSGFDTDR